MNAEDLLKLIPKDLLEKLGMETKVDHQVKKLEGAVIFKLLLYSMLSQNGVSYRVLEEMTSSYKFSQLSGSQINTKYNSIRDRICTIRLEYFESLFDAIFQIYNEQLGEQNETIKVDSTYVSIAAQLIDWSMRAGGSRTTKKQIKYTVSLKGSLPCDFKVYTEKEYASEDIALFDAISNNKHANRDIVVFDRGLKSSEKLSDLNSNNQIFVTRTTPNRQFEYISDNQIKTPIETRTLIVISDHMVNFKSIKSPVSQYRRIECIRTEAPNEPLVLLTNNLELSALDITYIYKQRWDIETFFKFLKQHLNLNHLVSRNQNGIRVMLYMTLITAMLITAFRKLNKIPSFKIAKLKFETQLDNALIKEIVIMAGGDLNKISHITGYT